MVCLWKISLDMDRSDEDNIDPQSNTESNGASSAEYIFTRQEKRQLD